MKYFLTAVVACFVLTFSKAQAMTGNEFKELCNGSTVSSFSCESYVAGFLSGLLAQADADNTRPVVCLRDGYTFQQLVDITIEYMDRHPQKRDHEIEELAVEAWTEWNPC